MKNILFYDSFPLLAEGAALAIREKEPELTLLAATNREMAEQLIGSHHIDLAIIGIEGHHEVKNIYLITSRKIPTVIFYEEPKEAFLLKKASQHVVGLASRFLGVEAFGLFISQVLDNGRGMCPLTQEYFCDNLQVILKQEHKPRSGKPGVVDSLSKREREIFFKLRDGKRVSAISQELGLKTSTVATVKKRIFIKLNISNPIQLLKIS